ncbi:FkbM family methyltransferase [Paraconexibacter sp.]|uniref:FkbM family methyltransferase n=1 Tax=Paraconexibacter sp. TaxID=2949640 RepID=UPI003564E721
MAARTGRDERFAELEAVFDPGLRRNRRDDYAARIAMTAVLRTDSCAIDVGANRGDFLEQIVAVAPNGRHFAFEPLPELVTDLRARFPQVEIHQGALSDVTTTATFHHVLAAPALSGLRRRADLPADAQETREVTVEVRRLDDVIPDDITPAFLKIDVEGAEVKVLLGGQRLLERARPVIVFEHGLGGADLYGSSSGELWDLLDACDLRVFDLEGAGPFTRSEFEELFTSPASWNYLAVPR